MKKAREGGRGGERKAGTDSKKFPQKGVSRHRNSVGKRKTRGGKEERILDRSATVESSGVRKAKTDRDSRR